MEPLLVCDVAGVVCCWGGICRGEWCSHVMQKSSESLLFVVIVILGGGVLFLAVCRVGRGALQRGQGRIPLRQ
jgi:hypothetical protein